MNNTSASFDDISYQNGMTYWLATDLMKFLGYTSMEEFRKVITKATKAMVSLNIECLQEIIYIPDDEDYRLTRSACYMIAMSADSGIPEVAQAQAYFVAATRAFEVMLSSNTNDDIERILTRQEITERHKEFMQTAEEHGLDRRVKYSFANFTNAGYRGMYNMNKKELAQRRGFDVSKSKVDIFATMGGTELAANLYRIKMTQEKIKKERLRGQASLEKAHSEVGRKVR